MPKMNRNAEGLTPKQARFVEELLVDNSPQEAAIRAGYSRQGARQTAYNVQRIPAVAAAIAKRRTRIAKKAELTREWVLQRLIANVEACMAEGEGRNPNAANRALELLGKEIGMFVDRRLLGVRNIDDMSEEELLEFLGGEPEPEELRAAAGAPAVGHA